MPGNFILLPDLYLAEYEAAFYLAKHAFGSKNPGCDKLTPITDGLKFLQPQAVENACTYPVSILTGPPGTGKTTTLRKIVDSYQVAGLKGAIVTPTGMAAKRADEVVNAGRNFVNKVSCSTIQSALEYSFQDCGYTYNRLNPLPYDYVIFEEYSMFDVETLRDGVEALAPNSRIVFCGDHYQLPSVGPGSIAKDLNESEVFPCTELDTVLRTGPNSGITYNANLILRGQPLSKTDPQSGQLFTDFYFVPKSSEDATVQTIKDWIENSIPAKLGVDRLKDIQLMCPAKNSFVGTKNMNSILREMLNPATKTQQHYGNFMVNDKVVNNKNNKTLGIVNGDRGFIKDIQATKTDQGTTIEIDFGLGAGLDGSGIVRMNAEQFKNITLAYASTVHKMQGSEIPVGILPVHPCHHMLLTRQLLYTGHTRAKQLGLIIGDSKSLHSAISNIGSLRRKTALKSLLKAELRRLSTVSS